VLGRVAPEPKDEEVVDVIVEGITATVTVPKMVADYAWVNDSHMVRYVFDKDGNKTAATFATMQFYATTRIQQVNGVSLIRIRRHLPSGEVREFNVEQSVIAVGGTQLQHQLGDHEIMTTHNKDAVMHLTAYMRDSVNDLVRKHIEMSTYTEFGWDEKLENFLLGSTMIRNDGTTREVLLGGQAASQKQPFKRRGTAESWAKSIDILYNHKNAEIFQYILCAGLASVLVPLVEHDYKGILTALTGDESGRGKTTVCHAALSAFGDADGMSFTGENWTVNARSGRMGTYTNIPMMIDEITNIKASELSKMAYQIQSGKSKGREISTPNGIIAAPPQEWAMHMYVTANSNLGDTLSTGQANSEAEAMRMFEFNMNYYEVPMISVPDKEWAISNMHDNIGSAGFELIKYVVNNRASVKETIAHYFAVLEEKAPVLHQSKYRFYRNHAAATLSAAKIMSVLGLLKFDLMALEDWACNQIKVICHDATVKNTVTPQDALAKMINAMQADIITTQEYRDSRTGNTLPETVNRMNNEPVGRAIMGNAQGTEKLAGRLYLSKSAMKDWCIANRVDLKKILIHAEQDGMLVAEVGEKFILGRGTNITTVQTRVVCFDLNKLNGISLPKLSVVPTVAPVAQMEAV
jgi:hypothetical protein